jgi:CHAD domain-containing protein
MRAVERQPGDEQLHEWRKRVKDLWYASQIVTPAAPKRMRRFAKSAHHLSDLLGDDHDLAVLKSYVDDHPYYFTHDSQRLALRAAIGRRREQLQREALALGPKLYQQSPKKFVRSVERSWRKRAGKQDEPVAA